MHHIPAEEAPALFAGIAAQLRPGGCAVVITRPQEVDYPLFARAKEVGALASRCLLGGWCPEFRWAGRQKKPS